MYGQWFVCTSFVRTAGSPSGWLTEGGKEGRKGHIMQNERTSGKKFGGRRAGRASPRLHNRILAFWTHRRTLQLASERARGTHTASLKAMYVEKATTL